MKLFTSCMVVTAAVIALGTGIAGAAQDVVTLKIAHFLPATSTFHKKNLIPWCDKINKESYGKLKCQLYPSMQLGGTPAQLFDQARDGVAPLRPGHLMAGERDELREAGRIRGRCTARRHDGRRGWQDGVEPVFRKR